MASLPKKGRSANVEAQTRRSESVTEEAPQQVAQTAGGPTRKGQSKTPAQRAAEEAAELARKDPFEFWRRNMVNENQMSHYQRQLREDEGLRQLQREMADQGRNFKNFWLRDLGEAQDVKGEKNALFENRTKFCPTGIAATKKAEKRMEAFKNSNWAMTDEGQTRISTRKDLFQHFHLQCKGDQPTLGELGKLMRKSQTHGLNLEKLAMEEEKRQVRAKQDAIRSFSKGHSPPAGNARRSPTGSKSTHKP